ncbi:MAG: gluconeogenesis factor YvcK family protein [Streptosporangiaceae bacterium]
MTQPPDVSADPAGARGRPPRRKVVALGGGHGLAASLSALRRVTRELTGIVTVADDGGSSGRLRREFGVLPPGDLRMALAALCGDDAWGTTWSRVVQHRFSGAAGPAGEPDGRETETGTAAEPGTETGLAGHAVGNVLIVALWELLGDTVQGLDWVGRLLGAHGRVLPMASVPLDLAAEVEGADPARPDEVTAVRGQVACASTTGRVRSLSLIPADPPACPEAVTAVGAADWIVLGPGSWFTSVIPHLLVPDLAAALITTRARRLVALNLAPQPGETAGFAPHTHLEVLVGHAPELTIDVVLADRAAVAGTTAELEKAAGLLGGRLVLADLAMGDGSPRHDPRRLAGAFAQIFEGECGLWH